MNCGQLFACILASYLIVGLPILIFVVTNIGLSELINQLVLIPAEILSKYRSTPFPQLSVATAEFYVFPLILITGLVVSLLRIVRYKKVDQITCGVFVISFLGMLLCNQVRVRSDIYHLLPAALFGIVLTPVLWALISNALTPNFRLLMCALFILVLGPIFLDPAHSKIRSISTHYFELTRSNKLPRAGYARLNEDLTQVVLYIQMHTKEDDTIFVGVNNHDQFIINHPVVYYLSGRNYPTRYHQFDPGVSNTLSAQRTIVRELEESTTRIIILTKSYWYEENDTRFDLKVNLLDTYIEKNFELETIIGGYQIWNRVSS